MKRDYMIYAVDFDGTLCEDIFPEIGEPNTPLIEWLKERRRKGDKVILWTCRVNSFVTAAIRWCKHLGLEFDAVNSNLPEILAYWGGESRKIYADIYIDDKAKQASQTSKPKGGERGEVKIISNNLMWCNKVCIGESGKCGNYDTCDYRKTLGGGEKSLI